MDELEMNVEERIGEKDGSKKSDDEIETEVRTMLRGYDIGLDDREDSISLPTLKIFPTLRPRSFPPFHTMDISSVCYRPAPVLTQAELTSTYGHPRLELPEVGKVNIGTRRVGFDVCREEERERRGTSRRLDMGDLTNRGIKVTLEEMEKKKSELKKR